MNTTWLYTLIAVLIVSLISLIGIFFISMKEAYLKKILLVLVSFSTGGLFGGAFIHLLPEAVRESGFTVSVSFFILLGILFFFFLEKLICWRHCHIPTSKDHPHPFTYLNLIGDALHNFIDGMVIAGSFLASPALGLSTTLAVILHEIPQEIGEFGVLVYGGFSKGRALGLNFLSAATSFLVAILVLSLSLKSGTIAAFLLPFAAGGFIYIAASDLLPEIKKETGFSKSIGGFLLILAGFLIMYLMIFHIFDQK